MLDVKTIARETSVVSAIANAVKIEVNASAAYANVAKLAAASLPTGAPIDMVAAFRSIYKAELAQLSGHGSMMIRENLLLILAPKTAVSLESVVDKKKVETHTTAEKAIGGTKAVVQQAAQQVREALGVARAEGGGRKPAPPATIPTQVTDTGNNDDLAFAAFLHNLPVYFNDPAKALKITGALKEMGFKLQIIK